MNGERGGGGADLSLAGGTWPNDHGPSLSINSDRFVRRLTPEVTKQQRVTTGWKPRGGQPHRQTALLSGAGEFTEHARAYRRVGRERERIQTTFHRR